MTGKNLYPNVFLIGAQKAGTTFLASCLNQHDDIAVSEPKEPHILAKNDPHALNSYRKCFQHKNAKIKVDASTTNSFLCRTENIFQPETPGLKFDIPKTIKQISPYAKLIYVLREPTDRVASAVRHQYLTRRENFDTVSLLKFMEDDPMSRLRSEYSFQIERYLEKFRMEDFIFVDYRKLIADPLQCTNHILQELNLDPLSELSEKDFEINRSAGLTAVGSFLQKRFENTSKIRGTIKNFMPASLWKRLRDSVMRAPVHISFSDYEEAYASFAEERQRIQEITKLDFNNSFRLD